MFLLQLAAQDIDEWLVRELPPGLQGSPHRHIGSLCLCPAHKFGGQARFADTGFPREQDELRQSRIHALVALDQGAEFCRSSQEWAVQQVRRWQPW
jgi:hypothetical protein